MINQECSLIENQELIKSIKEQTRKELLKDVRKLIYKWRQEGCPDKIEMCHECIDELLKQLDELGDEI